MVPLAWVIDRRGLLRGAIIAAIIVVGSVVLSPGRWAEYGQFLETASIPDGSYNLAAGTPLLPRIVAAGVIGLLALRWCRLVPLAVTLFYPVLWFHALSTLVGVFSPSRPSDAAVADRTSWAGPAALAVVQP